MLPHHDGEESLCSETLSPYTLLSVALVMVFYHSNKKAVIQQQINVTRERFWVRSWPRENTHRDNKQVMSFTDSIKMNLSNHCFLDNRRTRDVKRTAEAEKLALLLRSLVLFLPQDRSSDLKAHIRQLTTIPVPEDPIPSLAFTHTHK